jgi:hypothetical protein
MRLWLTTTLLVLVVCCGINVAHTARRTPPPSRVPSAEPANNVLRHERRFAAVVTALRAHEVRGPVGYVGDLSPVAMRADTTAMEQYFLSQFVVAPWILDADAGRSAWVLTNLHRTTPAERLPAGYAVVEDFGGGVRLLRRTAP